MLQILFEDLSAVNAQLAIDEVAIAAAAAAAAAATAGQSSALRIPGPRGEDGNDGMSIVGPQGIQGVQGIQGIPGIAGDDGDTAFFVPPTMTTLVDSYGRSDAQTAAVASVVAYTVGPEDGSFRISADVNVTTSTVHNFTVTVAYTDETNAARTLTLTFSQLAGTQVTAITNVTGAGPYSSITLHIRAKGATAITVATTGTFTTVTYNVEGFINQIH